MIARRQVYPKKSYIISHLSHTAVWSSSVIQRKVQVIAKRHWNDHHTLRPPPWGRNERGSVGLGSWMLSRIPACLTTLGQAKCAGLED